MKRSGDISALAGFAGRVPFSDFPCDRDAAPRPLPDTASAENGRDLLADLDLVIGFYLDPAEYDRTTLALACSLRAFIAPAGDATTRDAISTRLALLASVCDDMLHTDFLRH